MSKASGEIIGGVVCLVLGFFLWKMTGDVDTPVVSMPKVGFVLMLVGGAGLLYGLFIVLTRKR